MTQEIIPLPAFTITGISIRTSNETPEDIQGLWERFFAEGICEKIPGKISPDIVALYTGYDGDHTKPYTFIIGCRTEPSGPLPGGLISLGIEEAVYEIFPVPGGPAGVASAWGGIWTGPVEKKRAYRADFEEYSSTATEDGIPKVRICIGIRPDATQSDI